MKPTWYTIGATLVAVPAVTFVRGSQLIVFTATFPSEMILKKIYSSVRVFDNNVGDTFSIPFNLSVQELSAPDNQVFYNSPTVAYGVGAANNNNSFWQSGVISSMSDQNLELPNLKGLVFQFVYRTEQSLTFAAAANQFISQTYIYALDP